MSNKEEVEEILKTSKSESKIMYEKYKNTSTKLFLREYLFRLANQDISVELKSIARKIYDKIVNDKKRRDKIVKWNKEDFVNWYAENADKGECQSCHCSIVELLKFYIKNTTKRYRGLSWEIDRKDPDKNEYNRGNCRIICYYCNNAKSDVFNAEEFEDISKIIGETMKDIISNSSLLSST